MLGSPFFAGQNTEHENGIPVLDLLQLQALVLLRQGRVPRNKSRGNMLIGFTKLPP